MSLQRRSRSLHGKGTGAIVPDFSKPLQQPKDPIHEALAVTVLELKKEISGRDRQVASLQATIRELRTQLRFAQSGIKLSTGPKEHGQNN